MSSNGGSAQDAVEAATRNNPYADFRQLMAVDNNGNAFAFSGKPTLGIWNTAIGSSSCAGGNLLANARIPLAMIEAFENGRVDLGDRLMAALEAGLGAGGEMGPIHSAGIKIADKLNWPYVDLRVDWSDTPVEDLKSAWEVYKPQAEQYVMRALHPGAARSSGVPGNM